MSQGKGKPNGNIHFFSYVAEQAREKIKLKKKTTENEELSILKRQCHLKKSLGRQILASTNNNVIINALYYVINALYYI